MFANYVSKVARILGQSSLTQRQLGIAMKAFERRLSPDQCAGWIRNNE